MTDRAPALDDAQLRKLVQLIDEADSVELKVTVPDEDRRSTVVALGMDPLEAELRQVFFFDTPDLALDSAGVVTRARRTQGKPDDSVVKLRPVDPAALPSEVRTSEGFGVEVDALPGGFVCSGSMKGKLKGDHVKAAAAGERKLHKLFNEEQRAFWSEHAPDDLELDKLTILGPVTVMKLKFSPEGYKGRLVAELWFYPDGSRILELSTKCKPADAFDVAARTRAYLSDRGVNLSGEQQTKTRTALEYFSAQIGAEA